MLIKLSQNEHTHTQTHVVQAGIVQGPAVSITSARPVGEPSMGQGIEAVEVVPGSGGEKQEL